jgi:hypothetical protein
MLAGLLATQGWKTFPPMPVIGVEADPGWQDTGPLRTDDEMLKIMKRLRRLYDKGQISQEEYNRRLVDEVYSNE